MTRRDSWLEGGFRLEGDERRRDDKRVEEVARAVSQKWRKRWPDADLYYTDLSCFYGQDRYSEWNDGSRVLVVVFRGDDRVADEHVFRRIDRVGQFHHRHADPAYGDRRRLQRALVDLMSEYRRSADELFPALDCLSRKCRDVISVKLPYRSDV